MAIDSAKARKKIESISDLPTLPTVVSEIIALANSPKTNAADVGKMIEQDQSLTAKVLKLVNSSFYGFPGQIKSIQHAVVIIGFNKVKNIVVTASVFDLSKGSTDNHIDLNQFWKHNLGVAIGAKVAAPSICESLLPDDAFVSGLIHDIGKLILDQFLPEEYTEVISLTREKNILLVDAEKEVMGFTHCNVGSWIAERWKLPPLYQAPIQYHHKPLQAREEREVVASVHLGDILSRAIGVGNGGDNLMPSIDHALFKQYGLTSEFLDKAIEAMLGEIDKAKDFFDMIDEG